MCHIAKDLARLFRCQWALSQEVASSTLRMGVCGSRVYMMMKGALLLQKTVPPLKNTLLHHIFAGVIGLQECVGIQTRESGMQQREVGCDSMYKSPVTSCASDLALSSDQLHHQRNAAGRMKALSSWERCVDLFRSIVNA